MIKPYVCPFCGKEPSIEFVMVDEPFTNMDKYYEIRCSSCRGIKLRNTVSNMADKEKLEFKKEELIEEWNKRIKNLINNVHGISLISDVDL